MGYAKFFVAAVAAVLSYFIIGWTGGTPDEATLGNVILAGVAAVSVVAAPNSGLAPTLKATLAGVAAVFMALDNFVGADATPPQWWQLLVMVAGAFTVYLVPNGRTTKAT